MESTKGNKTKLPKAMQKYKIKSRNSMVVNHLPSLSLKNNKIMLVINADLPLLVFSQSPKI